MTELSGHFSSLDACGAHLTYFFVLSIEITYLCVSVEHVATLVSVSFSLQHSIQSAQSSSVTWSLSD